MPLTSPRLWIVATPIGNYGDLSPRAKEILSESGLVLAEDTRRAARLLRECGVAPVKLTSFHDHNEEERIADVLNALKKGMNVALVSDAGTPLIADPGYRLVNACHRQNIPVSPVPGPSAPVAALSAAGIAPIPYSFLGFLPRSEKDISDIFNAFAKTPGSLVFFERKDRLAGSLAIAGDILGKRKIAICRELTKTHEEFIFGRLEDCRNLCENLLGEITVIIGPAETTDKTAKADVLRLIEEQLKNGVKPRSAAIAAHKLCSGWTVKEIYELGAKFAHANRVPQQG